MVPARAVVLVPCVVAVLLLTAAEGLPVPIVGDVSSSSAEFRVLLDGPGQVRIDIQESNASAVLSATGERGGFASWTAQGLSEGREYTYTVSTCSGAAVGGRFRTLPAAGHGTDGRGYRIALLAGLAGHSMCRHRWQGFPVMPLISRWGPDMLLGLGDMIAADSTCQEEGPYGPWHPQVPNGDAGPASTVEGYLSRWRYMYGDKGLQEVLAASAYVATWDDGEITMGAGPLFDTRLSSRPDAGNGDGDDGDDDSKSSSDGRDLDDLHLMPLALEAMAYANPITTAANTPGRLYRSFKVGSSAEVFVLDLRQYRDPPSQVENGLFPKTLLGLEQKTWLKEGITASEAKWKVLVSSVPLSAPLGEQPDSDAWPRQLGPVPSSMRNGWAAGGEEGGYEVELAEIMEHLHSKGSNNVLFISAGAGGAGVFRLHPLKEQPSWAVYEVAVGPANAAATLLPGPDLSVVPGLESLLNYGAQSPPETYGEAKEWFSFGGLEIQGDDISVEFVNGLGYTVYSSSLQGLPNAEPQPYPWTFMGGADEYVVADKAEKHLVTYVGDVDSASAVFVAMTPGWGNVRVEVRSGGARVTDVWMFSGRRTGFFGKGKAEGLEPGRQYLYRASMSHNGKELEASGSFYTLPAPGMKKKLKLAFFGDLAGQNVCRDEDEGFPALKAVADYSPEIVIGLGDIVYADHDCNSEGRFNNPQIPHPRPPPGGCQICLPNFWDHCRYNHEDKNFKTLLSNTNFIGIWDDHEGVNDFGPYMDVRFNDEPDYPEGVHLLPFGLKGMLDCSPTIPEPNTPKRLYRKFNYGDMADIFVLDTRQYRDPSIQADSDYMPKTMLGLEQRAWLLDSLAISTGTWKIMVTSMPLAIPTGSEYKPSSWPEEWGPEPETWRDGWAAYGQSGGYENEMRTILQAALGLGHRNILFIATDVHCSFVYRHTPFKEDRDFQVHEIVTGPINAALFPKRTFSKDLFYETERLFSWYPEDRKDIDTWAEAKAFFNFGTVEIDQSGELTAQVRDTYGKVLRSLTLSPSKRQQPADGVAADDVENDSTMLGASEACAARAGKDLSASAGHVAINASALPERTHSQQESSRTLGSSDQKDMALEGKQMAASLKSTRVSENAAADVQDAFVGVESAEQTVSAINGHSGATAVAPCALALLMSGFCGLMAVLADVWC